MRLARPVALPARPRGRDRPQQHDEPGPRFAAVVSWVPHLLVPMLVALAFLRSLPRRQVMLLAPLVWLQDLDYLSPGQHRVYSHNIFVPLVPLLALLVLWRRREPGGSWLAFACRPGWPAGLALASYYLASHVFLDLFAGGVVLLWPLWDRNLFLDFEIWLDTSTNQFEPVGSAGTSPGAPTLAPEYPWLTYEHSAILAFAAAVALVAGAVRLARRRASGPSAKGKTGPGVGPA
jgi:hypothetical protein